MPKDDIPPLTMEELRQMRGRERAANRGAFAAPVPSPKMGAIPEDRIMRTIGPNPWVDPNRDRPMSGAEWAKGMAESYGGPNLGRGNAPAPVPVSPNPEHDRMMRGMGVVQPMKKQVALAQALRGKFD